jgi:hypothetical protein
VGHRLSIPRKHHDWDDRCWTDENDDGEGFTNEEVSMNAGGYGEIVVGKRRKRRKRRRIREIEQQAGTTANRWPRQPHLLMLTCTKSTTRSKI